MTNIGRVREELRRDWKRLSPAKRQHLEPLRVKIEKRLAKAQLDLDEERVSRYLAGAIYAWENVWPEEEGPDPKRRKLASSLRAALRVGPALVEQETRLISSLLRSGEDASEVQERVYRLESLIAAIADGMSALKLQRAADPRSDWHSIASVIANVIVANLSEPFCIPTTSLLIAKAVGEVMSCVGYDLRPDTVRKALYRLPGA